jgi:ubiquinone biosynthesis protein UbiJ
VGLTLAFRWIRGWLGYSEVSRLRSELRSLNRRLGEKDRHIARMLTETERLAERLQEVKVLEQIEKNVLD